MLVNVLDPEFLDPDDDLDEFLDPDAEDPGFDNVTFYLEPGEEVYVTLWIIDLVPDDDGTCSPTMTSGRLWWPMASTPTRLMRAVTAADSSSHSTPTSTSEKNHLSIRS